jgi:hypothetical protein
MVDGAVWLVPQSSGERRYVPARGWPGLRAGSGCLAREVLLLVALGVGPQIRGWLEGGERRAGPGEESSGE